MKAKFFSGLIAAAIILCFSEAVSARINLEYSGEEKYVSLEIENEYLKEPLIIAGKEKGGIFYDTADGRVYLAGELLWAAAVDDNFHGRWRNDDGRIVEVLVKPQGSNYQIKFSAEPNVNIKRWGLSIKASPQEYFTGCFERTVDGDQKLSWQQGITAAMNLRGQSVEMFVKPTLSLYCPFYLSSRGYGLFTKGTWPGLYDFCKSEKELVTISFEGPWLELILYTSCNLMEIVSAHSLNVGPVILPPKWAFSCWRWRDNHVNQKRYYDGTDVGAPYNSQVVEDILMMEALDIPCGVYWVDRPWAVGDYGYNDFEWDRERLPNPENMIKWLEKKSIRFMLWIAPWVSGDMSKVALEKSYNVKGQTGKVTERTLVDFTNTQAKKWWQNEGVKKVLDDGVAGFKLDRAEEVTPSSADVFVYDGRSTRQTHNDYPLQYVKATWEITKEVRGDDFMLMPRSGYTGSSRYSGFWGGDIASPAEGLRAAIIAQQRSAIIGYPIWGSDTGGYWGGDLDREVCARWLGFSCFSPIMEVGPTEDRGLWDMKNEPNYDIELIAIWRLYAKLHTRLMDYSYACAKEARESGIPIVRPLFLVYPEQEQAWENWQTYLYGPDILVSPVWEKATEAHSLYLPADAEWVDVWDVNTTVYEGGQDVTVDVPLYKIPIFVRKDAEIIKVFDDLEKLYNKSLAIANNKPNLKELERATEW
ncbi:MAG: glycoside hydrolase family 31 protein [Phycisphaerales bacterium]|jgi:alpha-glucosidase (family GH31 glycosyl hydrolase)